MEDFHNGEDVEAELDERGARGAVREHKSTAGTEGAGAKKKKIKLRSIFCTPEVGE